MNSPGDINKYYQLVTTKVTPNQLVLDPSNPRINVDVEADRKYSEKEIISEAVQSEILNKINMDEYRVSELKRGIERNGFLTGMGSIIVEKVAGTDKYIVLEGNRRTTAIKSLLNGTKKPPPHVLKTLEIVEVKEFKFLENLFYEKDEIIDILLGTIHITGPVAWGAMEKAYYIYKTYQRELERLQIRSGFHLNTLVINKLSSIFNCKNSEIVKSVRVYRVYQQLKASNYNVDSKKFSLIEIAVANKDIRSDYFEMGPDCHFSDLGMERFSILCLQPKAPITNPQLFNQFKYIFRHGSEKNLAEIENGLSKIESVYESIRLGKDENRILDELKEIEKKLLSLNVVGFSGEDDEKVVVDSIARIVNQKLVKIVEEAAGEMEFEKWYEPTTVDALLELKSSQIQELIKETIRNRPNQTCIKENTAIYMLKNLEIVTARGPKARVLKLVNDQQADMIASGLLREYQNGKNVRVKLLVD